jgi:hypothetical protein
MKLVIGVWTAKPHDQRDDAERDQTCVEVREDDRADDAEDQDGHDQAKDPRQVVP